MEVIYTELTTHEAIGLVQIWHLPCRCVGDLLCEELYAVVYHWMWKETSLRVGLSWLMSMLNMEVAFVQLKNPSRPDKWHSSDLSCRQLVHVPDLLRSTALLLKWDLCIVVGLWSCISKQFTCWCTWFCCDGYYNFVTLTSGACLLAQWLVNSGLI